MRATLVVIFALGSLVCGVRASAQEGRVFDASLVPAAGASESEFVTRGWKVAARAEGDLDGDGRADRALHLVEADTYYDPDAVTAAPESQALVVLLAGRDGKLRRAGVATRLLQPVVPQYIAELKVERGVLVVHQNYGMTQVWDTTHRFRYEAASGRFVLIGRDNFYYTRPISHDDTVRTSENYLTGVRLTTTGHVRKGVVVRETTKRERIERKKTYMEDLDEIE
jgi:hypothetical protein